MASIREIVRYLCLTPPADVIRRLRGRAGLIGKVEAHRLGILRSRAALRVQKLVDFLNRYEMILERAVDWRRLDFEGARVLELGAGPLLGWGPLALFRGASQFVAVDPGWRPEVLNDPEIAKAYFRPLWRDLSAIYGPRMDFPVFMQALRERAAAYAAPAHAAALDGHFDIVLSNSCLEHIAPLDETLKRIADLTAEGGRFLHLVDFGNHRPTPGPFDGLYDRTPEAARRRRRDINLLRASDILHMFEANDTATALVPYASVAPDEIGPVDPAWRAQYDDATLAIKTAIFASRP
ncbi:MAG: methyltransferase domain-containing protein [Alphaproteobacteria bacterium]